MKVRTYKAEDSVGVKNLILTILGKEYPFDQSAYQDSDINDITGTYSGEGNGFFVVEQDRKIVGGVGIKRDDGNRALVRRFFVDKDYRKRGFGTMLIEKAIEFCRDSKYEVIIFRATDRMAGTMELCKKMGFKETESLEVSGFHIHTFILKL